MHELGIAEDALKIVLAEAGKNKAAKVTRIKLKVGKLTEITPDTLKFNLETKAKGTIAEKAEIEIEEMLDPTHKFYVDHIEVE